MIYHILFYILVFVLFPYRVHADDSVLRNDTFNTLPNSNASFITESRTMWDHELPQREGDHFAPFIYSGGLHGTSSTLTTAAFATVAYMPERVNQSSIAITYNAAANDVCWTIISSDNNGITGWTRVGTTAYYYFCEGDTTPTEPVLPPNSAWLMLVRVSGSALTTVHQLANPHPTRFSTVAGMYNVKAYGAVGNGVADDAWAVQAANDAAAVAGGAVWFPVGTYGVNITTKGSSLTQTASWYGVVGGTIIRRLDFTASVSYYMMQQTGQTGLTLDGLIFDGQVTTAVSSSPNVDLAAVGSYADTNTEALWRKVYGVQLFNATRATVRDCTFMNFLRAGLRVNGDGLTGGQTTVSTNVMIENVRVIRTRGIYGDGLYFGGVTDLKVVNTHVYDYQRIGLVLEFAATDAATDSRNVEISNTTTDYGHDAVAAENNAGFWLEQGDNIQLSNFTSQRTAIGYVLNAGLIGDTGTTRPWTAAISITNSSSLRTQQAIRAAFGGSRSVHLTVKNFFGEADRIGIPYAYENSGLRGGIQVRFKEANAGVQNLRADFSNIKIHNLNQSTGAANNAYGAFRISQGVVTAPQQMVISLTDFQTQWSKTDGTDDVAAKTDYQSNTNGYFGDVILSGRLDNTPDDRFRGHFNLTRAHNHTFGYVMMASEVYSTTSQITIHNTPVSLRNGTITNNGALIVSDCQYFDLRGDLGWTRLNIQNSVVTDLGTFTDRTSQSAGLVMLSNNTFQRQLYLALAGGDSTHRLLRLIASNNRWNCVYNNESCLRLTTPDGTYAQAVLSNNVFINNGGGTMGATKSMIEVTTLTGVVQFVGAGNAFDSAMVTAGGHIVQYNTTPTYNDDPTVIATPFLTVFGVRVVFSPI